MIRTRMIGSLMGLALRVAMLVAILVATPAWAGESWGEPDMTPHGPPAAIVGKPAPAPGAGEVGPPPGGHVWEWPKNSSITQARHGWAVFHALEIVSALLLVFGGGGWVMLVRYDRRRTRRLRKEISALGPEQGAAS
jgi:hypothetical protein